MLVPRLRSLALPFLAVLLGPGLSAQIPERCGDVLFTRKIVRGEWEDQFGRSVDVLGDLDDDGVTDLVVGASHCDHGADEAGSVWIFFMNADRTVRASQQISMTRGGFVGSLVPGGHFGKAVAGIGDLDGDGVEDLAVGAAQANELWILFLNRDGTVRDQERIYNRDGDFGYAIVPLEDRDGDGVTDLAVGTGYGAVWLLHMNRDGTPKDMRMYSDHRGTGTGRYSSFFGIGLGSLGDVDGDGIGDIAVGDTSDDSGGADAGAVVISLMGAGGTPKQETKLFDGAPGMDLGLPSYPNFGRDIAQIGDLDGNGVRDLAIGCSEWYDAADPEDSGAVFIVFMNADGTALGTKRISRGSGNLDVTLAEFYEFGISVAPIGDFNGDGVEDLAVGARFDGGTGAVYLLMLNDGSVTPPVAAGDAEPRSGNAPLAVQCADLSSGSVTSWLWDFGDGETSTEQNPLHVYRSEGVYDVTLTVTGPGEVSDQRVFPAAIDVLAPIVPVAQFDTAPTEGLAPLDVAFTDLSLGIVSSWTWDLGDGATSREASPTHVYTEPGTYAVSLHLDGPYGSDDTTLPEAVRVHEPVPPVAAFTPSATSGDLPLRVDLADASTGFVESWLWEFGDGATSTERSPSHTYTQPGTFLLRLTVSNGAGSSATTTTIVATRPPAPVADFTADAFEGGAPLKVRFTDLSGGDPYAWNWDFGDGGRSTLQHPVHVYQEPGLYTVKLTARGWGGSSAKTVTGAVLVHPVASMVTSLSGGVTGSDAFVRGYQFRVSGRRVASRLGIHDANGNGVLDDAAATPVALWRADGTLLAQAMVQPGASVDDGFFYAAIPRTELLPGESYVVACLVSPGGEPYRYNATATLDPAFQYEGRRRLAGGALVFPTELTATDPAGDAEYFGPDVRFEDPPRLTLSALPAPETDAAAQVVASLQRPAPSAVTVTLATRDGSALAGRDYAATTATLVLAAGESTATFSVPLLDDSLAEPVEDFTVEVVSLTGAELEVGSVQVALESDEAAAVADLVGSLTNTSSASNDSMRGIHFTVLDGVTVTELGVFDGNGNGVLDATAAVPVGLWTLSGTLVAQAAVPVGTPAEGGVFFAPIPATVLPPGGSYVVAALYRNGQEPYRQNGTVVLDPRFRFDGQSSKTQVTSLVFPDSNASTDPTKDAEYFGGTLRYLAPDFDQDGIADALDPDDDNDGVADTVDAFPHDPTESADSDGDGVGDNADAFPFDGTEVADTDGDGVGDVADPDADGDGLPDEVEMLGARSTQTDDLEVDLGWLVDPDGTDTATAGSWQVADPGETTSGTTVLQPGTVPSGLQALVTGADPGASADADDVDGGLTSALSPPLAVPRGRVTLSFRWFLAHTGTSGPEDFLRVSLVEGGVRTELLLVQGAPLLRGGQWTSFAADLDAFAGGTVHLLVEAADLGADSVLEAGLDDLVLAAEFDGADGDGIPAYLDLDSDNDGVWDVSEAGLPDLDLNGLVDDPAAQASVLAAPDTDGDGIPDFLDVESANAANDGTAFDVQPTGFAFRDANADGRITADDPGGGADGDRDGLDDLIDGDPFHFGSLAPDCDGDGVTDSLDDDPDCNGNGIPDTCEVFADCNANGIPDECEPDCDGDGIPDDCDPCIPVAAFGTSTTFGTVPLTVAFTDLSDPPAGGWLWDFGDGTTSGEKDPVHVFDAPGTYTVSLTATGAGGSDTYVGPEPVVVLAPVLSAGFSLAPESGTAPLAVQFSDESLGTPSAWSWDFGDGATSSLTDPLHVYALPGTYAVSLTVTDAYSSDARAVVGAVLVLPVPPTADLSASPTSGPAPLDVQLTDLSTGGPTAWLWDFGDGTTSTAQSPLHTYTEPGTYTVTLTASNDGGSDVRTAVDLVHVTLAAPVAELSASPTSGPPPLDVQLTDLSTGAPTAWLWDFGDGATSAAQSPLHTYTEAGTYTVTLTASNDVGSDVRTAVDLVRVGFVTPVAAFSNDPSSGPAPLEVHFQDLSTGEPASWLWEFGDGGTSTLQDPVHTYLESGTYSVRLTVAGAGGGDSLLATDHIVVAPEVLLGIRDGGFERDVAGSEPASPWVPDPGTAHRVRARGAVRELAMPTQGTQWLELSPAGTSGALPPETSGGATAPAVGGAGVEQTFRVPRTRTRLLLDAAYLPAADVASDEWMSIDVSDGLRTNNLFLRRPSRERRRSRTDLQGAVPEIASVEADLLALFPDLTPDTPLTLRLQVGDAGGGAARSRGFVDHVRLEAPPADEGVLPLGCGVNPEGSLVLLGAPVIGSTMVLELDNPLGTQCAGSTLVTLYVAYSPDAAYPCGSLLPGYGMEGPVGERVVDLSDLWRTFKAASWAGAGSPVAIPIDVPLQPALIGTRIFAQGLFVDTTDACGTRYGLTDGLELIVRE